MEFDPDNNVIVRFHFKEDRASEFSEDGNCIVEQQFDDLDDVIEYCREFEDALQNVTVLFADEIIELIDFNIES